MSEEKNRTREPKPKPPNLAIFQLYERFRFIIYGILTGVALNLIWGYFSQEPPRYSAIALVIAFGIIGLLLIFAVNRRMMHGRK